MCSLCLKQQEYFVFHPVLLCFLKTKMRFLPHLWELNPHQSSAKTVQEWSPTDLSFPWLCCVTSWDHLWCLWELVGRAMAEKEIIAKVFSRKIWGAGRTWHEKGWEGQSGGHLWHSSRAFLSSLGLGAFFTPLGKDKAVCGWTVVDVSGLKAK